MNFITQKLAIIGMTGLMVACNTNPNSSPSPLQTQIVGKWECNGEEPIWKKQYSKWEFYDNKELIMASHGSVSGVYTFISSDQIRVEWSNGNAFERYDISISEGQLKMSNVAGDLSCKRL